MSQSWPFTAKVNPNRLATEFIWENATENEFAHLADENFNKYFGTTVKDQSTRDNKEMPSGMIKTYQDLNAGGTTINIPVFTVPTTMPVAGDTDMKDKGVTAGIKYITVKLNKYQDAYDLVTGMEAQKVGKVTEKELNDGAKFLRRRYTMFTDRDLYYTVFNGTSAMLTTMSGMTGAWNAITPHSHGNIFTVKTGMLSYTNGRPMTSGYEDTVAGALEGVTEQFTPELIEELEYWANELNIPYFQTSAGEYRILLVHDTQLKQLKRHEEFRQAALAGGQGLGFEGPAFKNFQARWSKTLVYSSTRVFGVQKNQDGSIARETQWNQIPKYGPTDFKLGVADQNDIKGAILLGPNMITKAVGQNPVKFSGWEDEASEKKLLIMRAYQAYVMSDIVDEDGKHGLTAGSYDHNESSLVAFTYSPSRRV